MKIIICLTISLPIRSSVCGYRGKRYDARGRQCHRDGPRARRLAVRPGVTAAFGTLVSEMMAKDPELRAAGERGCAASQVDCQWRRAEFIEMRLILGRRDDRDRRSIFFSLSLRAPSESAVSLATSARICEGSETEPSFFPYGQRITFAWTGADGLKRDIYIRSDR